MNLAQLIAAVYIETNRPDLVNETMQAVLEATQSVHMVDYWYKDVIEAAVTFTNPLYYIQTLDTSTLPLYRDFSYIRKADPSLTPLLAPSLAPSVSFNSQCLLTRIDIGDAIDSYGYEKQDVWYQAGTTINIKSSTPLAFATAAWYQYPTLDPTGVNYKSWIANELPWVIIYKAAGAVFAKIGEDKSWSIYMKMPIPGQGEDSGGLYYQQLALLKRANIRPGD